MIAHKEKMPKIGIIGGCGPYATLDIEQKILRASLLSIPSIKNDQDYYPMVVSYTTQLQNRIQAHKCGGRSLSLQLEEEIHQLLLQNIDILLIACQSAHVFINNFNFFRKVKFINMIDTTIDNIVQNKKQIKSVGLLGTSVLSDSGLYQKLLQKHDIKVITLPEKLQFQLNKLIYFIKSYGLESSTLLHRYMFDSSVDPSVGISLQYLKEITNDIKIILKFFLNQHIDKIILACTELPLLKTFLNYYYCSATYIDSNELAALRVVQFARSLQLTWKKN